MSTPATVPVPAPEEPLSPPRPFFIEQLPENEEAAPSTSAPVSARQSPRIRGASLRPHDRSHSTVSVVSTGASTPRTGTAGSNPFATPTQENANPFSPPASVVSFSIGPDSVHPASVSSGAVGQHYPFSEVHQRLSTRSSSSVNVPQSPRVREAFTSPPPRPLTVVYPSATGAPMRVSKKTRPRSTMLEGPIAKPWARKKDAAGRISYVVTYTMMLVGVAAAFLRCYYGWKSVPMLGNLCLVLEDQFQGTDLDTDNIWMREADMGGFGNGEFEMTTASTNNSFIRNNQLYLLPTLTSSVIGKDAVFDGYTFNLTGCTNTNLTACSAVSNRTAGTVINPVMSARLSTKGKRSIRYGRVEVRAKLPRGDWMWPAIWMLPENNTYGPWPLSGEIDIMESRGNSPDYPAQGINYVRGSLNWGPLTWLNAVAKTYGWWTERRSSYGDAFHLYALEWSDQFLRIYVDNRLHHMLDLRFTIPFFQRGDFPASVSNASQEIILENPWANSGNSAPFDQPFYLILDVAIGGTNGWFPDGAGNKPWLNGALNAMELFAEAQDQWSQTWPQSEDDRAMIVDYVKMWELC